jgi:hypothetical protein
MYHYGLSSFGCQVRYAHFAPKTPRQKWLRHNWLTYPPLNLGKVIRIDKEMKY